jgi:hypothetical protein
MKRKCAWLVCLLAWASALTPATAQVATCVAYTLLEGSYFVDDCLVCGRPTILLPMRGTFELVLQQNTAPYTRYAIQNLDFTASAGTSLEKRITGQGTYTRFEEFAILQDMTLATLVRDTWTNHPAFFTNNSRVVQVPFPLIQADLTQTNGTLLQTFSMHLLAAPAREIWFSVAKGFVSTNRFAPTNQISAGDLLSNRGRVVKRNADLVSRLGVMPPVPDLGLDAVQVARRGEILFSIPVNVFSESLGPIQHGDLLSSRGAIVKRNHELLAAFHPASSADAGLDALQFMPDGQILFSIRSNVVLTSALTLSRGDILSDRGTVFMSHQQVLANFQPTITNRDFGLDALTILPSGEIWFSVEEGFVDKRLGQVLAGDLLSSFGYRVLSNAALLAAFAPADPGQDSGLDALFVVTDTQPAKPPPCIVRHTRIGSSLHLEWNGEGDVFQLEWAPTFKGPWTPCSEIVPDLAYDSPCAAATSAPGFYRLRQW